MVTADPTITCTLAEFEWAMAIVWSRAICFTGGVALVPFLDMLNHSGSSPSTVEWDGLQFTLELRGATHHAREQIFISYPGRLPNDVLLPKYGFVVPNNEYESPVELRLYDDVYGYVEGAGIFQVLPSELPNQAMLTAARLEVSSPDFTCNQSWNLWVTGDAA